jgi:hypothetical protein
MRDGSATVWTEEPGIRVQFSRKGTDIIVTVTKIDSPGEMPTLVTMFTLANFRWKKILEAVDG